MKELKSVRNANHVTNDKVLLHWARAAIQTTLMRHAIEKLEKVHNNWLLLKKNKGRMSDFQQQRELEFSNISDTLFDISHADALFTIKIKEDVEFLKDQQKRSKNVYDFHRQGTSKEAGANS